MKRDRQSVNIRHAEMLALIRDRQEIMVEELSEIFGISTMTVRRDLQVLEEQGKIVAAQSEKDHRSQIISLTEEGRQFAEEVFTALYDMEERAFSCFSDKEVARLVQLNHQLSGSILREVEEDLGHARQ